MNAGAYGGEMKDVLVSVRYLTAEGRALRYRQNSSTSATATAFSKKTAAASSRQSSTSQEAMPRHPLQDGRPDGPPQRQTASRQAQRRQHLQAAGGRICGGLIDQCGLRGYRHGGAAVSDKHCGFVVNLGGATCADVLALCDEVRAIVKEKTGYDLEKEIRVVEA